VEMHEEQRAFVVATGLLASAAHLGL